MAAPFLPIPLLPTRLSDVSHRFLGQVCEGGKKIEGESTAWTAVSASRAKETKACSQEGVLMQAYIFQQVMLKLTPLGTAPFTKNESNQKQAREGRDLKAQAVLGLGTDDKIALES